MRNSYGFFFCGWGLGEVVVGLGGGVGGVVLDYKFRWFKYVLCLINPVKLNWSTLLPSGVNIRDKHNVFFIRSENRM